MSGDNPNLVRMSWDPITRIVGSLGLHTTIDFANRRVVECHSTSSIFRGYSIFMKGKDPRDAHFITSRHGGDGALRDAVEYILRAQGKLQNVIDEYILERKAKGAKLSD